MRHPQHRSVFKPELQQRVVNELEEWEVRVAFDNNTHRKQVIADDALLQSSSNLIASDDWLGNSGTLLVHADACAEGAANMERRWSDLETVRQ